MTMPSPGEAAADQHAARRAVAVDLSHDGQLIGAVVDDTGRITGRAEAPLNGATGDKAVAAVIDFTGALLAIAPGAEAVSVGTPGIVDEGGVVRYATVLQWRNVPLADRLRQRLGVPALIGNDIDVMALAAVHHRGAAVDDLILVSLDNSIGMGIMVGGRLVAGEHFNAGEIAHVTVFDDGATCVCGRRGCIVAYISAARTAAASPFVSAETKRDATAAAGRAIGALVAPIASALNLTTVLITGPSELAAPGLIRAASDVCESRTLPLLNTHIEITALTDDADLVLLGAATRALASPPLDGTAT